MLLCPQQAHPECPGLAALQGPGLAGRHSGAAGLCHLGGEGFGFSQEEWRGLVLALEPPQ